MKTLIVYASKHGCVEKCVGLLKDKIEGHVDVVNIEKDEVLHLAGYEKVCIGGSIYMGRIQKEIKEFCMKELDVLKEKGVGLFICGMNTDDAEKEMKENFPDELLNCAFVHAYFGGEFNFDDMNFIEKTMIKMVFKSVEKDSKKKDSFVSHILETNIEYFARAINYDPKG